MTTAYSNLLGLALPVTGELSGTWGDTVNDYITKYLDDAIANAQVISGSQTAVTLSKTTGTALVSAGSGSTGSAQYALIRCTGNPASTLTITVSYSSLTNSQFSKTYLIFNSTSTNQSVVVQATTSSGTSTGVTITAGERALIAWNGTDFVKIATQSGTGEFVTVDTTNLEVTNIKAKDGTAAATIADSTGAITVSTLLNVDNLRLDGNTLSSTDSNGNVVLAPNGTGDVQLDADTVRVGDSAAAVTLTSNGAGALTVTTGGAADLILNTNSGTNSGSITIGNGTNGNITVATNGTGDFYVDADTVRIGDSNANATITTNGTGDLILNTNAGTNSGSITIEDGVNGNIIIAPNGTGQVQITNAALDLTTIEVTNIKAKDGTASMTLADTTGIITLSATAGTANGVLYLNGSRAVTSGSALTFDGSTFNVTGAASVTGTNSLSLQRPVVPSFLGQGAPAITWQFYSTGTTYTVGASIQGLADAAWTSTSAPTSIRMYTVPSGSTSLSERLRIAAGGQVNIGGNFDSTNNTLQVTGNTAIGYTTAAPTTGLIVAGNVGIGTDSPAVKLHVQGSAGQIMRVTDGTTGASIYSGSGLFGFNNQTGEDGMFGSTASHFLYFATNGAERARIDSSGTLILRQSGTPANTSVSFNTTVQNALTLDASGNLGLGVTPSVWNANNKSVIQLQNTSNIFTRSTGLFATSNFVYNSADDGKFQADGYGVMYQQNQTTGAHVWLNTANNTSGAGATASGISAMTLDALGNLVVGATSTAYRMEVVGPSGDNIISVFRSGDATAANNAGGGFRSISSATAASRIAQLWLDADGANLSGGDYFYIQKNGNSGTADIVQYSNAAMTFATDATERARITSGGQFAMTNDGTNAAPAISFTNDLDTGIFRPTTNQLGFATAGVQAMTLDASGRLGIGETSPVTDIDILRASGDVSTRFRNGTGTGIVGVRSDNNFTELRAVSNHGIQFSTNNTEVARITSGGDFRVKGAGTAGSTDAFQISGSAPADAARLTSGGDFLIGKTASNINVVGVENLSNGAIFSTCSGSTNATSSYNLYSTGASAYRFYVDMAGTIFATSTTISAISDQRFKENIRDLDVGLDAILALKPRKFDWKAGKGKDKKDDRGFIAQEFEQVFPDLIDTWKDPAPEGEEPYKSVRQDLIPVLVKAIQEQQAMIKQLEAKVASLEAK